MHKFKYNLTLKYKFKKKGMKDRQEQKKNHVLQKSNLIVTIFVTML